MAARVLAEDHRHARGVQEVGILAGLLGRVLLAGMPDGEEHREAAGLGPLPQRAPGRGESPRRSRARRQTAADGSWRCGRPSCRRSRSRPERPGAARRGTSATRRRCCRTLAARPRGHGRGPATSHISLGPSRCGAQSPRRHGHVVPHAHWRHDPHQLELVPPGPVQPDDQRIGVVRLVVQRREQARGRCRGGRGEQARFDAEGRTRGGLPARPMGRHRAIDTLHVAVDPWSRVTDQTVLIRRLAVNRKETAALPNA